MKCLIYHIQFVDPHGHDFQISHLNAKISEDAEELSLSQKSEEEANRKLQQQV